MQRVIHWVLPPPQFRPAEQRDWKLDHPKTYEVQAEVTQQRRDLELDAARPGQRRGAAAGWTSGGWR
jgi:hypothetical protein